MERDIEDGKKIIDINKAIQTLAQQVTFNEALKITIDYTFLYNQKLQELENLEKSYTESLNSIILCASAPTEHFKKKCTFWDWVTS